MPQTAEEKAKVNRFLGSMGLGQLSDPGLISQIGFLAGKKIKGHDDLKRWLNQCEPEERQNMLEALKPYLKFPPKPLDVYVAEIGMDAEARQLPIWEDGKFRAFNPTSVGSVEEKPATDVPWTNGRVYEEFGVLPKGVKVVDMETPTQPAIEAFASAIAGEAVAKEHLLLICGQCTREALFHGWDRKDCVDQCRKWGWRYDIVREAEICPECSRMRPPAR